MIGLICFLSAIFLLLIMAGIYRKNGERGCVFSALFVFLIFVLLISCAILMRYAQRQRWEMYTNITTREVAFALLGVSGIAIVDLLWCAQIRK